MGLAVPGRPPDATGRRAGPLTFFSGPDDFLCGSSDIGGPRGRRHSAYTPVVSERQKDPPIVASERAAEWPERLPASGVFTLLSVLFLGFYLVNPPERTLAWDELFNAGHVVLFAAVFVLVRVWVSRAAPLWSDGGKDGATLGVIAVLALASEASQIPLDTRVASITDVLRDVAGAFIAVALTTRQRWRSQSVWRSRLAGLAAAAMIGLVMINPLAAAAVYYERDRQFPVVATWTGAWWEDWLIVARDAELAPAPSDHEGDRRRTWTEIRLNEARYPGVAITEPYPDWSGYARLVFDVDNDGAQALVLGVDVHDRSYEGRDDQRFNQNVVVGPGLHRIEIPLSSLRRHLSDRPLDLTAIRGIRVYGIAIPHPCSVRLSDLRLE